MKAKPCFFRLLVVRVSMLCSLIGFFPGLVNAAGDPVTDVAERHVRQQLQASGTSGQISIKANPLDPRMQLPPCPALEAFSPPGSPPVGAGRINVGVRCNGPVQWSIFVPVNVSVISDYILTARPLLAGQVISTDDLTTQTGDLGRLPRGLVTDAAQAVGKSLKVALAAGQPLRKDLLVMPSVVLIGQTVKLQVRGNGFSVTSEGRALNNAAEGQVVQVRMNSGQNVSGIARAGGVVDLAY